jgi:hypothetical protein
MQAKPKSTSVRGDERLQRAILALVVSSHPHYRTIPELGREFGHFGAVREAVACLVSYGLILLHGNTLLLTPAAFHAHRLEAW